MNTPIGRTTALWLGAFALLNLPGQENLWWIDVRPLPQAVLALPGLSLLLHGLRPHRFARPTVWALLAVVLWNAVRFYAADVTAGVPVPFSVVVAGVLLLILYAPRTRWFAAVVTVGVLTVGFPLAHVAFFGLTDYSRRADVIVVFGARCYADGQPSQSLEDRVRTACDLYHAGLAPRLLMSGGPGDGSVHETESMRRLAIDLGVPAAAVDVDRAGLDTRATVAHTGPGRVLAVSHFYHLPRIKMAYRRAGRQAFTVPAKQAYIISKTPYLVAREVAAFWWYLVQIAQHGR